MQAQVLLPGQQTQQRVRLRAEPQRRRRCTGRGPPRPQKPDTAAALPPFGTTSPKRRSAGRAGARGHHSLCDKQATQYIASTGRTAKHGCTTVRGTRLCLNSASPAQAAATNRPPSTSPAQGAVTSTGAPAPEAPGSAELAAGGAAPAGEPAGAPATRAVPEEAPRRPATMDSAVVLPAPLAPRNPNRSPAPMPRHRSARACTSSAGRLWPLLYLWLGHSLRPAAGAAAPHSGKAVGR